MKTTQEKKKKVLLISTFKSPFIENDIQLLEEFVLVNHLVVSSVSAIFLLVLKIISYDIVLCWFASVYSGISVFLAKLMRKQTVVILGGSDVAIVPEIGYGIWLTRWKRPFVRYAIVKSNKVLVVDPSLGEKAKDLLKYEGKNINNLPTGYREDFWCPVGKKEDIVLTVAQCQTLPRFKVKGIDFLIEAAILLPEVSFYIVGVENKMFDIAEITLPANVKTTPYLSQDELLTRYQQAKIYCQPSRSEGFPNCLCEAMLCECIPIGTEVGGISTSIGNTGMLVPYGDVKSLVISLKKALAMDNKVGHSARQHIIKNFSFEKRREGLRKTILELVNV